MKIRKAIIEDSELIAAVAIATWVDTYAPDGLDNVFANYVLNRFAPQNIEKLIENNNVYVAETEFGICGYALVSLSDNEKHEIETMYILPKFQGKGIGRKLMNAIKTEYQSDLWLKCADYNPPALSFYRSLGFTETGETWFELAGVKYRCLIFESLHNQSLQSTAQKTRLD
jgi:ribosomal protein S18 acetylase RimI-like enzyme